MMHEIAETLTIGGEPVLDPHTPENRPWDGALYLRICEAARSNGDPFHGVLYADAAAMVAAHQVPPQVALTRGQCHEHLTHNVAPRRLLDARTTAA